MNKINPKVSIILTSFNHAKYLREAIDSALAQTFTDFELIIWDDASSDNSWEIIQTYTDPRIKSFRNDRQRRGIFGINKAITEVAQGEYIAIHHSDDVWEQEKLEKQVAYLNQNKVVGAVFTNALVIDEQGEVFKEEGHFYYKIFDQPNRTRHEWLRFFFEKGNALCHPSVLIRKQCYSDCGLYRYGFAQLGDFDMWIRLALRYEIHVMPEKLFRFRVREGEANTSGNRPETHSRGLYEYSLLLNHYLKINVLDDLIKIFPEARKFCNGQHPSLKYAFAMAILEIKPFYFTIQFALNLLSEILNDPHQVSLLAFDSQDFIKLSGELDPIRVRQVEELNKALQERDSQIAVLSQSVQERDSQIAVLSQSVQERDSQIAVLSQSVQEREMTIQAIQRSASWRVTAPLRKLSAVIKNNNIQNTNRVIGKEAATLGPRAFFTICSKNFLAHARALHDSIRPHYPDSRFFVVLCDKVDGLFDPAQEPFEFIYLEELKLPNLAEMAHRYNITEFNTAVKPFAFLRLMEDLQSGSVVYLDPDLFFVDRMHEVDQLIANGAQAVLTPHLLQPAEHDQINDRSMLQFGIYNLGFLALRNTPAVIKFLQWWGRRLEKDCVIRLEDGLFVDQKWADLLPAFVPGASVLHHPGYNVAYWNLPQRKISRKADRWFANDQPLRFVHFSGNRLDDPNTFSRHSQQVTIESIGVLRELVDTYRQEVYKQGHAFYRSLPYAYSWDGVGGVNLHTPKELDFTTKAAALSCAVEVATERARDFPGVIAVFRHRYSVLRQALPIAKRLSGGWGSFVRRGWAAYRRHGWRHVKAKAVELSGYRAPPVVPVVHSLDQTHPYDEKSKRLLYLDWAIPKPDQDAASVTAALLLQIFDSIGYKVTFVPCGLKYEPGYYEDLVAANIDVIVYPTIQSVKEWLQANAANYDVCVMARGPVVWPYLETIKACAPNLRLIFNTVDLHYLRELRQAELAKDEAAHKAALVLRDQELELIDKCDLTILLSNDELYTVREHRPEAPLTVLPVVFKDIPGAVQGYEQRRDILFIGSFPHKPNIDAVIYFAESVFPIIKRQILDIRFKVIGANPPEEIQRLSSIPGIEILGFVKELEPVFADIRLTVAPLRYGAGIKGKIGTSLCYGVPCVATPMAVEGMGLTAGLNVLVGDSPEAFASAVCDAYKNEGVWQTLSTEGYKFAVENYSVEVIRERIRNLLFAVNNGWRSIHNVVELDGWEAFTQHAAKMKNEYERRVLREQALLPSDGSEGFRTSGFCCVCGTHTHFLTSFMYSTGNTPDGRPMPNWREHLQCEHCGLVNRMRAALNVMHIYAPPEPDSQIYITERLTKTYQWLAVRYPKLQGSEYFGPSHQPGSIVDGIRHEDVMSLSFVEDSFDRVLSFDVLEHVPDPYRAFCELYRVLKPGGVLIFSVPFSPDSATDIVRATLEDGGAITHLMPAEYHGNPVDPEGGALCFRYFGWEMLCKLKSCGFFCSRALALWSEKQGYLGIEQYIFIAKKSKD
jgi:glycosyltransferase involved in cell wall biosynthesis